MNKTTKYYLNKIKQESEDLILVDYGNQRIIKIIQSECTHFDREIRNYLIQYYAKELDLDFFYEYDIDNNLDILIYPMFTYNLFQHFLSSNILYHNTKKILNNFVNSNISALGLIKEDNKIIHHIEIFSENTNSFDFFLYKNKFYLLNLGKFYFKMYDKDGNLIHRNQLDKEAQRYIHKYNNQEYRYIIL